MRLLARPVFFFFFSPASTCINGKNLFSSLFSMLVHSIRKAAHLSKLTLLLLVRVCERNYSLSQKPLKRQHANNLNQYKWKQAGVAMVALLQS